MCVPPPDLCDPAAVCFYPVKHSVFICATREPTLLGRLVLMLYWAALMPDLFQWENRGTGTVQVRLVVDCDPVCFRDLLCKWEKLAEVQSLVTRPLDAGEPGTIRLA